MTIVSIGSTHPLNSAGLGADAEVVASYFFAHAIAVAGVTAQNARGVAAVHAVPADVVRAQLAMLPQAAGYRVGALASAENVRAVSEFLRARGDVPIVVDPVLAASTGETLSAGDGYMEAVRDLLLRLPAYVTPNVDEARTFTGARIQNAGDLEKAGRVLVDRGARAAVMKGGHLEGDPSDVLVTREATHTFEGSRLPGTTRGTGCRLAAALLCELAAGCAPDDAVERARIYVRTLIASEAS